MDSERFDELIRRVGSTQFTRGSALRGLAASALAAVLGTAFSAEGTDARRKKRGGRKGKGRTQVRAQAKTGKVTICHFTSSATNPYVIITISGNALASHVANHGDFVYGECCLDSECDAGQVCAAATDGAGSACLCDEDACGELEGCCGEDGACHTDGSDEFCGNDGGACDACEDNEECVDGTCEATCSQTDPCFGQQPCGDSFSCSTIIPVPDGGCFCHESSLCADLQPCDSTADCSQDGYVCANSCCAIVGFGSLCHPPCGAGFAPRARAEGAGDGPRSMSEHLAK